MDVSDNRQLDVVGQVAKVRARARPWRAIIALVLAAIAAAASAWARSPNHGEHRLVAFGHPADKLVSVGCALLFALFALVATLGLSRKAREVLEPRIGSAHAAVIGYAIVLAGGIASLVITLELLHISVGNLILGGAFTAVLIGIAAQQSLGNLFAGMVLLLARPFAVGDRVRMRAGVLSGQVEGVVSDIGITYVRLETDEGRLSVPNSQVLAAAVGPLRRPAEARGPATSGEPAAAGQPGQPAVPAAAAVAPLTGQAAAQHPGADDGGGPGQRESQR